MELLALGAGKSCSITFGLMGNNQDAADLGLAAIRNTWGRFCFVAWGQ